MYIRTTKSPTSKFTKVYLVEGYRDENGKPKQRVVKAYGNLEELQEQDPGILEKLRAQAKSMPSKMVSLELDMYTSNREASPDLNYGAFFLEGLLNELRVPGFLKEEIPHAGKRNAMEQALTLLSCCRFLDPASKRSTHSMRESFFCPFDVSLDDLYRCLDWLSEHRDAFQKHLHQQVCQRYGRDQTLVFYDVTNYYFETEQADELRKKGVSKEYRPSPLVQMGLMMDRAGLPIAYRLFPGNTNDTSTLLPFATDLQKQYGLERFILTADRGINSTRNLLALLDGKNGYIVSQKIRGTAATFVEQVLDEDGYRFNKSGNFKVKSFVRKRTGTDEHGNRRSWEEKVVCFWSRDFDAREKHKRKPLEEAIDEYLKDPAKYKASNRYGVKKYLEPRQIDPETGEVLKTRQALRFDREKYERDVALDGYYALVSSELDMTDEEIVERYRGLWRIEDSFRILKSDLEGRPVYVRRAARIDGHFFICYLALLLGRILEFKLGFRYPVSQIRDALRQASCRRLNKGLYSLSRNTEVFEALTEALDLEWDHAYARLEQIRQWRKAVVHNV